MTYSQKLKLARGKRSTDEIGRETGISPSAIRMYEAGLRIPRDEIKKKLANFFGISVQELFFEE